MGMYKVTGISIIHNGTTYGDGATIELNAEEARPLKKYLTSLAGKTVVAPPGGGKTKQKTDEGSQDANAGSNDNTSQNGDDVNNDQSGTT